MPRLNYSYLLLGLAEQSNLSRRALANRANMSLSSLEHLLSGGIEDIKLDTVAQLAKAFNVPVYELLKPYFQGSQHTPENSQKVMNSHFMADVTIPDNSLVVANHTFEKVWRVVNTGTTAWKNTYLQCQDSANNLQLKPVESRVPIPHTLPGQEAFIAVKLKAPSQAGNVISHWKAVNAQGQLLFPNKQPLYCAVKVICF